MKKLLVSVLAIAGLVACNNDEVVRVQDPAAIAFETNWVNKATRADVATDLSYTADNLTGFNVWGFMDSVDGKVFEAEAVTGSKGNFSYANTQYWAPGHTYYFAALAPMVGEGSNVTVDTTGVNLNGLGTVNFVNTAGKEDLIYAANVEQAPALGESKTVNFTFNHLLSKVKFSFANGFSNDNAYIDVKNVRMVVPAEGSINLAQEDWWSTNQWVLGTKTVELNFGDACAKTAMGQKQEVAEERFTIPADATFSYAIAFDVVLYMGDVVAYNGTKKVVVEGKALEIGKAYNFSATLNASNFTADGEELQPIVFDVQEVKDWVDAGDVEAVVCEVKTEAELVDALKTDGIVRLANDIALTAPLFITNNNVVDLNDNDLTIGTFTEKNGEVSEGDTDSYVFWVQKGAKLTINGDGNVTTSACEYSIAVWAKGGEVVINGGNYTNAGEGSDLIYASAEGKVEIYGGKFQASEKQPGTQGNANKYSVLNLKDRSGSSIVVYGGEYYKFNPANNFSEGANTNFVAEGYTVEQNGDWYIVK